MRSSYSLAAFVIFILFKLIINIPMTIKPNNFLTNIQLKPTEKILLQAFNSDFKPNHFYKIMVHYLGSV